MTIFGHGLASRKDDTIDDGTSKPTALLDGVIAPTNGFGIRSYLHQFYQSSNVDDIEPAGAWYLLPPPPAQRTGLWVCRVLTVFGLILLIGGAIAIVVGYTWPHEGVEESIARIAIYQDENGIFYVPPEKLAEIMKDPMRRWKMFGLCMFATGAVLLALSLLTPALLGSFKNKHLAAFMSEDSTPNEPPTRLYPAPSGKNEAIRHPINTVNKQNKITSDSGPVPALKEIAKVQPNAGKIGSNGNGNDDNHAEQTVTGDLLLAVDNTQQ